MAICYAVSLSTLLLLRSFLRPVMGAFAATRTTYEPLGAGASPGASGPPGATGHRLNVSPADVRVCPPLMFPLNKYAMTSGRPNRFYFSCSEPRLIYFGDLGERKWARLIYLRVVFTAAPPHMDCAFVYGRCAINKENKGQSWRIHSSQWLLNHVYESC